ncbi:MAG: hypothetical protein E5X23_05635 [Mesorhizobium sp.]|uniref:hypothetical protein n=1 Tax=unclassified Mesorhizobium TaxID=325217 RepID=UPI000F758704|nr:MULTISPECIES: hypothetical protein [unclassified Mesorhizobium]TGV92126.1 hypothetical protein EN801_014565 [Mesorhizobium sp. M00.F.Ca.ET.158.01.1.1]AZO58448.1 hypothetical protein EJ078_03300 [Mesorhizobium sp. M1A.F.Ca.IN.022.06.1.1]MCT2579456.1 hypothetical protein [Mesorhizobium sp. P13.3]MDF3168369.1 hypothetical protein [Mesorhizobium sp. P16.1]MDF3177969.1 hypothetical protein [Mesorhizobium sp. P17.1]
MQRPSEWPIWHGYDLSGGGQDISAPFRNVITLAHYLEKQHAHRRAALRRTGLSTAAANAVPFALRILQSTVLARKAIERIGEVGVYLSKTHREFSTPDKHR